MMKLLKKIDDKKILYIFTFCVIFLLQIVKQTAFYLQTYGVIESYDSIKISYMLYFCIPFLIYLYIKNLIKVDRDLDIFDYIFFTLVVGGIVVSLFSLDVKVSFLGKDFRHEGFLSLLSYYLMFINWKLYGKKEDIKTIYNMFVIIALINAIYAIFQIYFTIDIFLWFTPAKQMATGLCGNPNFFGSLITTIVSMVTTKYLLEEKCDWKNILVLVFLFFSLINSQSSGPILTYFITLLFLIIFVFVKKKQNLKKIGLLILMLIATYTFTHVLNNVAFKFEKCEMCDFANVIKGKAPEGSNKTEQIMNGIGSGRKDIWIRSFNIAKNNIINGVGYDNLHTAYYEGENIYEVYFVTSEEGIITVPKYTEIIDNAHNVYLHTAATSGLIGLIPYLLLCLLTFIKGLKVKENLVIIALGGFVAYSIQAFANLSVIHVAPIYYIIIGLILCYKEPKKRGGRKTKTA